MNIPELITRLVAELRLPTSEHSFAKQFAGWQARVIVGAEVLNLWVDRGEFWASIEHRSVTTLLEHPQGWESLECLETKTRYALVRFRDHIAAIERRD